MNLIDRLTEVLEARREAKPQTSYVARLYADGLDKILEKVGEESIETLLAAKNFAAQDPTVPEHGKLRQALLSETADLWFHTMVMLIALDCRPEEVLTVLEDRFGLSGLAEKAQRAPNRDRDRE